jgi:hypothetical protein
MLESYHHHYVSLQGEDVLMTIMEKSREVKEGELKAGLQMRRFEVEQIKVPICCLLPAVCCLLSAVCCLLSAVCCLVSAV